MNNFKKLEEQESREHGGPPKKVAHNIKKNIGVFHFVGDIFELYFPKMFNLIIKMTGGSSPSQKTFESKGSHQTDQFIQRTKYPNTPD